jgi:hypothetical protein
MPCSLALRESLRPLAPSPAATRHSPYGFRRPSYPSRHPLSLVRHRFLGHDGVLSPTPHNSRCTPRIPTSTARMHGQTGTIVAALNGLFHRGAWVREAGEQRCPKEKSSVPTDSVFAASVTWLRSPCIAEKVVRSTLRRACGCSEGHRSDLLRCRLVARPA